MLGRARNNMIHTAQFGNPRSTIDFERFHGKTKGGGNPQKGTAWILDSNHLLVLTGHANEGSSWCSALARVSRQQS